MNQNPREPFGVELSISMLLIMRLIFQLQFYVTGNQSTIHVLFDSTKYSWGSFFIRVLNFEPLFVDDTMLERDFRWGIKWFICFTGLEGKCFYRWDGLCWFIRFEP